MSFTADGVGVRGGGAASEDICFLDARGVEEPLDRAALACFVALTTLETVDVTLSTFFEGLGGSWWLVMDLTGFDTASRTGFDLTRVDRLTIMFDSARRGEIEGNLVRSTACAYSDTTIGMNGARAREGQ